MSRTPNDENPAGGPERLQDGKDTSVEEQTSRRSSFETIRLAAHHDHSRPQQQQQQKEKEDGASADLESLRPASTAPPWSVFTPSQKRFIVFMVSLAGFFSPLSANIYFPALNTLADDFGTTESVMNLTLTSYMIFQGLSPTIFGDLADMAGRRPAYIIGFIIYIGACIGIASCNTFAALLVLRCLQSTGSASTIALGSGVVADMATSAERGMWMGWATSGPMIAPAIAPVLGGLFTQFLSWRWMFWFLVILAASFLVPFVLTFPETGRKVVGNGSIPPQGWNMSLVNYIQVRRQQHQQQQQSSLPPKTKPNNLRLPNPLNCLKLILQKDVGLLLFYNSIIYSAQYDIMSSLPSLLSTTYNFNSLQIGLSFIPMGIGAFLAPTVSGKLLDANFRRIATQIHHAIIPGKQPTAALLGNFPLERARMQIALPMVGLGTVAVLLYGWIMQIHIHSSSSSSSSPINLSAPLILTCIIGFTYTSAFNAMSVLLVDLYPASPATATAANNLVRCCMGAGSTAVILYMIEAMGRGWCFTLHAAVVAGLSPILLVLEKWGPGWREARRVKEEMRVTSANSSNSVVPTTTTTTTTEQASDSDQAQNHKEKSSGS